MNLKKIGQKITALFITTSMLYGNFAMCGVGIGRVIAENLKAPKLNMEITNSAFVRYDAGDYLGTAIQSNLSIVPEQTESNLEPLATFVEVNLPEIDGKYPEKVILAKSATYATSAGTGNAKVDQNYDQDSGLLSVAYENLSQGRSMVPNTRDEFEIIYIYSQEKEKQESMLRVVESEEEVKEPEEVNLNYIVNVEATYKTENEIITSTAKNEMALTQKENDGDLSILRLTGLNQNIYKGYMYSNEANGTDYSTDFATTSTLSILDKNPLTKGLNLTFEENRFELNDEEQSQISASDLVYTSSTISKDDFYKIFGQEGYLDFYNNENLIASVKHLEMPTEEEGVTIRTLSVIYSDGSVDSLEGTENIIVNFKEGLTNYNIRTSKPIQEGLLNIVSNNSIKPADNYGTRVSRINHIVVTNFANNCEAVRKIQLLEPEMSMNFTANATEFNVLDLDNLNKTSLTITLNDTNSSYELYENPTIEIILPEEVTGANISSPEIVNGNGLQIKETRANGNVITIELEGKQTGYDFNNLTGGTTITLDLENIAFPKTLSNIQSKIFVKCMQNGKEISKECNVNIRALAGVMLLNEINGLGDELTLLNNEEKSVRVESEDPERDFSKLTTIVNNYSEPIYNVIAIGKVSANSTFSTMLKNGELNLNGNEAKVYYSENINADINDASWQEEYTENAKAFAVVLEKLDVGSNIQIKSNLLLPNNLGNNQESSLETIVTYTRGENAEEVKSALKIQTDVKELEEQETVVMETVTTEKGIELPVKLTVTPIISQNYVHAGQVVTYKIKLANMSENTIEGLTLKDIVPSNANYIYMKEEQDEYGERLKETIDYDFTELVWNIEKLEANEAKEFEIRFKVKEDITEEQELLNKVVLFGESAENVEAESRVTLKPSEIEVRLKTSMENTLGETIYKNGSLVGYILNIKNISNKKQKNVEIKFNLPKDVTYISFRNTNDLEDSYSRNLTVNKNELSYKINNLEEDEEVRIIITTEINRIGIMGDYKIDSIANVICNGEIYDSDFKQITTNQPVYNLNFYSNRDSNEILNPGDEIIYTLELDNTSNANEAINFFDILPENLKTKKIIYYTEGEEKNEINWKSNDIEIYKASDSNKKLVINIIAEVSENYSESENEIDIVNSMKLNFGDFEYKTNEIKLKAKAIVQEKTEEIQNSGYSLSGKAWVDLNKNGNLDFEDNLLKDVKVTLVDKANGKYVRDNTGNVLTMYTDQEGNYSFKNLENGLYVVLFEYNDEIFTTTTYKKENVLQNTNSDAIQTNVKLGGMEKIAGITNDIYLNSNYQDIDIGLIVNDNAEILYKEITNKNSSNMESVNAKVSNSAEYIVAIIFSIVIITMSVVVIKKKI